MPVFWRFSPLSVCASICLVLAGIVLSSLAHASGEGGRYGTAPAPVPPTPTGERGVPDLEDWPDAEGRVRGIDNRLDDYARDCVPWAGGRTALLRYRDGESAFDTVKLVVPLRDDAGRFSARAAYYWYDAKPIAIARFDRLERLNWFGAPDTGGDGAMDERAMARAHLTNSRLRWFMSAFPTAGTDPSTVFRDGAWRDICAKLGTHRASH